MTHFAWLHRPGVDPRRHDCDEYCAIYCRRTISDWGDKGRDGKDPSMGLDSYGVYAYTGATADIYVLDMATCYDNCTNTSFDPYLVDCRSGGTANSLIINSAGLIRYPRKDWAYYLVIRCPTSGMDRLVVPAGFGIQRWIKCMGYNSYCAYSHFGQVRLPGVRPWEHRLLSFDPYALKYFLCLCRPGVNTPAHDGGDGSAGYFH